MRILYLDDSDGVWRTQASNGALLDFEELNGEHGALSFLEETAHGTATASTEQVPALPDRYRN